MVYWIRDIPNAEEITFVLTGLFPQEKGKVRLLPAWNRSQVGFSVECYSLVSSHFWVISTDGYHHTFGNNTTTLTVRSPITERLVNKFSGIICKNHMMTSVP